jgi:hypothetical protein
MSTEAIEIFLAKGKRGVLLSKDALSREEKDVIRERFGPEGSAGVWFLEIAEDAEQGDDGDFDEEQELDKDPTVNDEDGDEPTMDDLRALTVAKLKELADKEEVDLTGLTLKDDILGRMAAHFGLDPAS